uniref:Leucine-rich repeat-containing protein 28-like n=1 Tax=Phallusia mammillata TaxID=59560 RepID=A0A6F9DKL1_9ASCI|nr:leucine-rich repeat-containing protein 28-like [Phallusia mammillata]
MDICDCQLEWLQCLQSTENSLLCNYSGLKTLPTDKLCQKHQGLVKKIYLKSNKISSIPDNFHLVFRNVMELYLPSNRLDELPASFVHLACLENVNLDTNLFKAFPKSLFGLAKLKKLVLRNNEIEVIPSEIGKMAMLQHLDVSFNKLKWIPGNIGGCKKLEKLWVNRNRLSTLPRQLCEIPKLAEVNVSSNRITHLPIDFGKSPEFKSFCMDDNKMFCVVPHHLKPKVHRFSCTWRTPLTHEIALHFGLKLITLNTRDGSCLALMPEHIHPCSEGKPMSLKDTAARAIHQDNFFERLPASLTEYLISPMGHCYFCNLALYWTIFVDYAETADLFGTSMHSVAYFCSVYCAISFKALNGF